MPSKDFRIIFMGTPEFAVASLKALIDAGFHVVAVVTAPDRPAGRGQKLQPSEVKVFTQKYRIPVLQPEKLRDPGFIEQLKSFQADLQVVVAFRMLPEMVWNMPVKGTINLHASLLPQYRGAAPINWAIINGDKKTGVTTFFIEKEIDTGKILFKEEVEITDTDDAGSLHDKLMETGAKLLVKTVSTIETGQFTGMDQQIVVPSDVVLKSAPKIFKETCKISWDKDIRVIYNFIRGLSPYPAAWTVFGNETGSLTAKIFQTEKEFSAHRLPSGTLLTDEKTFLKVAVEGGYLSILSLQMEGKKRLGIEEFLRGVKNISSWRLI